MMTGHSVIARTLRHFEVDTIFGLMGDANMLFLTDFMGKEGGRFVAAVHEGSAVSMADGYSRVTKRVGVASVTHGPGLTNTLTAMTEAVRARSAVIILTGRTPKQRDHVQEIDIRGIAGIAGAQYHQVLSPEHIPEDIAQAMSRSILGSCPVVLDIPVELMGLEVEYVPPRPGTNLRPQRILPDAQDEAVDRALGIIATARRPLILAGRGAVLSGAREELLKLADLLSAPVATTVLAKDYFCGHPYNLGVMGGVSHSVAVDAINDADCIVAFGASMNSFTTVEGSFVSEKKVIHLDNDPTRFGQYMVPDAAIWADARAGAQLFLEQLATVSRSRQGLINEELRRRLQEWTPAQEYRDASSPGTVDMRTAITVLDAAIAPDRAVVTDAGRFIAAPWRYMTVQDPIDFTHTVAFGSIGLGLATAIGFAAARLDRLTVAIVGDGGGMMGLLEFGTAVRNGLPLIVIVLNDGSYGMEYHKLRDFGVDPAYSLIEWPEFADVARSLGGFGLTIRSLDDLHLVGEAVAEGRLPLLVDIKADPAVDIGLIG